MEGRLSGVEEYTINILEAIIPLEPEHEWHLFYSAWHKTQMPVFTGNVIWHHLRWSNKCLNGLQLAITQPRWDWLVPDMDVFWVPNMRLMPLRCATPLVVTAHDLSFVRFPEFYSWRRRIWHKTVMPKTLFKRANRVIAVSQATANDLTELYEINERKIRVVLSGVKTELVNQNMESVRQRYQLPKHYWLFLGVWEPRKNIESLVRAYTAIADQTQCDLVLAGSSGWLESEINRLIENSSVRHRIHRVGFIEEKDKQNIYAEAELFIYPSFYEGFGFPPLEALIAGTPVVTARTGALPEVAGRWATMVDPYSVDELAQVLGELAKQHQNVPVQTRQEIQEIYDWKRTARQTLDILKEVCE